MQTIDEVIEELTEEKNKSFPKPSGKVSVDLEEYIDLQIKATFLDRILYAIDESCSLDYDGEALTIRGSEETISDAFKILYPYEYRKKVEALQEDER